jgi:NAD(P)-dependent dehydrogenase (short-subunit alcohol dehydrogenase family)
MQAGYNVMAWDIESFEPSDPILEEYASRVEISRVDIRLRHSIQAALFQGQLRFGLAVHAVINNAAIAQPYLKEQWQQREEQWKQVIDVNLTGTACNQQGLSFLITMSGTDVRSQNWGRGREGEKDGGGEGGRGRGGE